MKRWILLTLRRLLLSLNLMDEIEVEDAVESEDETVPASVHKVGESSTAPFLREDSDGLLPGLMRRDINSLFGQMASLSRRLCGRETAHALVEKKGKAKDKYYDKVECKRLKKELEEAKFSNTFLRMQNGRVERDLYWTRVRAHEFYQEMIRRGFMFKERPNEAIDVPIEDEKSPSSEQVNVKNDVSGSGPVRGQDTTLVVRECTFARFMKYNPAVFHEGKKVKFAAATLEGPALTWWKTKVATMGLETVNQMP
ncbi:hypothetical protein Tco_1144122 [Tanacetum coccineum]